jgi:hypothetical protein
LSKTILPSDVFPYRGDVRVPHVHRHCSDAADLFRYPGFPKSVQATLLAVFGHVQHSPSYQIIHQRQMAMAFPKRLLIDANLANQFALRRSNPRFTARSMIPWISSQLSFNSPAMAF